MICNAKDCFYNKNKTCQYEEWAQTVKETIANVILDQDGKCVMKISKKGENK